MTATAGKHQFVIERSEWFSGGDQLGPDGREHLQQLAAQLPATEERLIVEAEPLRFDDGEQPYEEAVQSTTELNERRRSLVAAQLTTLGVADAEWRVVVQPLKRVGVRGIEAPGVFLRGVSGGRGQGGRGGG